MSSSHNKLQNHLNVHKEVHPFVCSDDKLSSPTREQVQYSHSNKPPLSRQPLSD